MTMHDKVLQNAYRAWMARDPSAHLDEAAWERLAINELTESERNGLLRHVLACADCSEIWKALLALRLEAAAQGLIAKPDRPVRSLWRSSFVPLAIAATLILALAGVFVARRPDPSSGIVRGDGHATIGGLTSQTVAGSPMFTWTAVPTAARYRVSLFTEDGRPVWTTTTASPQISWPSEIETLRGKYKWRVEALSDGAVVARSLFTDLEVGR